MSDETVTPIPSMLDTIPADEPAPAPPVKRKPGRPKGSRTRAGTARPRPAAADVLADAAAAVTGPSPAGPGRPSNQSRADDKLRTGIANAYTAAGSMLSVAGVVLRQARMVAVGAELVAQAEACAGALVAWSATNPAVRRALEAVANGGGAGLVLAAHAPIAAAALGMTGEPGAVAPSGDAPAGPGPDLGALFAGLMGVQ